jgi:hypothetical protein
VVVVHICGKRGGSSRIEHVMWWMLSTIIMAMGGMLFEMFILIGKKVI